MRPIVKALRSTQRQAAVKSDADRLAAEAEHARKAEGRRQRAAARLHELTRLDEHGAVELQACGHGVLGCCTHASGR